MLCRNTGTVEEMSAFFSSDMLVHFPPTAAVTQYAGAKKFAGSITKFRQAFSGWQEEVVELWGNGDRVVCRAIERGVHQAEYNGFEATGKTVEMRSITVFRVSDTAILEQWYMFDAMILMQQLGVDEYALEQRLFPERSIAGN